jgi:hypothetical protein
MMQKLVLTAVAAALVMFGSPAKASAHGAAHAGYTHVGPNGVYHAGATAVGGYGRGYHYGWAHGGAVGGYRYGGIGYGRAYGAPGVYLYGGVPYYGWPYGTVGGYGYIR